MNKIRYKTIFRILFLSLPLLMIYSCNEKEEVIVETVKSNLVLENKFVEAKVGSEVEINILEGNNDYNAFSLNDEIATVDISGDKLIINALQLGRTGIIVSDAGGNYISVDVTSFQYETIDLESNIVDFKLPIGNIKTKSLKINEGNGGYKVISSDQSIVSAEIVGDTLLVLTGKKEGKVNLKITDGLDFAEAEVNVEVTTTTEPYDEAELQEIMDIETLRYVFSNMVTDNATTYFTLLNGVENNRNIYGWDYYNFYYLKIYFEGDKEVGVKENCSLIYRYSSTNISSNSIDFQIIKNDGEKIWAIYSFVLNEKLEYGYFIQKINP